MDILRWMMSEWWRGGSGEDYFRGHKVTKPTDGQMSPEHWFVEIVTKTNSTLLHFIYNVRAHQGAHAILASINKQIHKTLYLQNKNTGKSQTCVLFF